MLIFLSFYEKPKFRGISLSHILWVIKLGFWTYEFDTNVQTTGISMFIVSDPWTLTLQYYEELYPIPSTV